MMNDGFGKKARKGKARFYFKWGSKKGFPKNNLRFVLRISLETSTFARLFGNTRANFSLEFAFL